MAKTEEGEFEFILGNKQLITVFLLVVVLLAIFFSAGYIMGRNSAAPTTESARSSEKSVAVESPPAADSQPASSNPATTSASEPSANPSETISPPAGQEAKRPAQPAPAPAKPAPAEPGKPKPSAVGPAASAPAATRPPSGPASVTAAPAAGSYWQVVATARPDAEIIAEALNKKGFHAQVAPGPRDGIFRVLVGPLKDSATQAQTRTGLEAAGFKNPIMRKY